MASSREYLDFIMGQLSLLEDVRFRAMMGEYIIYYRDKVAGGIYDDRFLIKITDAALKLLPDASYEIPYEKAKKMLLVDDVDNKELLKKLFESMYDELPALKPKKKKISS